MPEVFIVSEMLLSWGAYDFWYDALLTPSTACLAVMTYGRPTVKVCPTDVEIEPAHAPYMRSPADCENN